MPDTLKPKKTRNPKQYEAIEKGALNLKLEDRVELRNRLTASINGEYKEMQARFDLASKLVNGKE